MFKFVQLPELKFDMKAVTTDRGRVYTTPNGNLYPSVTTVLSTGDNKALEEWKERVGLEEANRVSSMAARRGTALHTVCEKYLLNEMPSTKIASLMPTTKELFFKIRPFLDISVGRVLALEQAMYSDKLGIAGRVDCIAEWNGKLSIVDFKSSTNQKEKENISNYFMQCTAYSIMFRELTKIPIDQIVVLIGTENGPGQCFVESASNYVAQLQQTVSDYYQKSTLQLNKNTL